MNTPETGNNRNRLGIAASAATLAFAAGGRMGLKVLGLVWRGLAKTVATIWRLTGALDAALWRGLKLGGRTLALWLAALGSIVGRALSDFLGWLPPIGPGLHGLLRRDSHHCTLVDCR